MKRLVKRSSIKEVYHGTSSNKLDSILATGIMITDGGFGDGAYVTKNLEEAKKYALKRAGELKKASKQYPQFEEVYPVVIVIQIEESDLKHGFQNIYFAEEGIGADKIIESRDISSDQAWQDLLLYVNFIDSENDDERDKAIESYQRYYSEVAAIV